MEAYTPTGEARSSPDLHTLLDRLLDEAEGVEEGGAPTPQAAPTSAPPQSPPTAGGTNLLGGLLANPALLSALPVLAENLGPLLGTFPGGVGHAPTATRPHTVDRHTALICAVKPYLSPHRQEAAETVIRLCRVWDALERSGISLSGLLSSVGGGDLAVQSSAQDKEVT